MPQESERGATSTEPLAEGGGLAVLRGVSLVVHHRDGAEVAILSEGRPVVVGRTEPSDMRIPDRTLSREHARFVLAGSTVVVEDLGSTNGVWIAGTRVPRAELAVGGEVMLGSVIARIHGASPAPDQAPAERRAPGDGPVVAGSAMRELMETVARVAASRVPLILHGETGTGKEVIARLIHDRSPRRDRPLVRVNCGAIPADLVESTLFGHEKGAFTGAAQQQKGVFEEASRGTVFLDEIGELPLPAQVALLRVLETGSFSRVGGAREVAVDVRVIAATHRDLEAMTAEGTFREDLFYRLSTFVLEIPPLRDRRDEIDALAARFLRQASAANGRRVVEIEPEALELLRAYRWPGNVRELRNAIERAVVVAQSTTLAAADLPARVREAPASSAPATSRSDAKGRVQGYEAQLIEEALRAAGWNQAAAASKLGMPVRTLGYRMKILGIKKPET